MSSAFARRLLRGAAALSYRAARRLMPGAYAQDGLISVHNHDFMRDAAFQRAYARGLQTLDGTPDYEWHWRIHVGLWAASAAVRLDGDFVECGVNRGFLSSAIMTHLDWDTRGRLFWLLDTFAGLDAGQVTEGERAAGMLDRNREELARGFYVSGPERALANFAQWRQARVVVGTIPGTLAQVSAERIAYLHLDLNCAAPEVAAIEHFWPRLVPGALVLLDDYAYRGFGSQKQAMDDFARRVGVSVCSLPTGQGLLLRPPA